MAIEINGREMDALVQTARDIVYIDYLINIGRAGGATMIQVGGDISVDALDYFWEQRRYNMSIQRKGYGNGIQDLWVIIQLPKNDFWDEG